jgi:predicted PurR-regulated permease PerM
MNNYNQLPYYMQLGAKLLLLFLLGTIIYLGHDILVPVYFSILLSIVLLPVTNLMERIGLPKALANLISVTIAIFFIVLLIYFLSSQISSFISDLPSIKKNLSEHYVALQNWLRQQLNISFKQQTAIIQKATVQVKNSGGEYIGQTFSSLTDAFITIVLTSIYSFLFLFYRHHIKKFLLLVFKKEDEPIVLDVLTESKGMVKNYMLGLLVEMAIVAIMASSFFLIIGIKYAIFLGVFLAILNIVPYIGIFTAGLFAVLVTLTTSSQSSDIAWIVAAVTATHLIDSNFILPKIVGSKVKINTLATILGVVTGGTLIGLSGIFLALPTIAFLKIIFDRVDSLKPWGMLLGDEVSGPKKGKKIKKQVAE